MSSEEYALDNYVPLLSTNSDKHFLEQLLQNSLKLLIEIVL